jgi:hypothetical protein
MPPFQHQFWSRPRFERVRLFLSGTAFALALCCAANSWGRTVGGGFGLGDVVRLNRSETLLFKGENYKPAPKNQEFTVLKQDSVQKLVYVAYYKEDGSAIAVSLPSDSLEAVPADGWSEVVRGMEAFREQRYDEARRALSAAAQDAAQKNLVAALQPRLQGALTAAGLAMNGKPQAFLNMVPSLREFAVQIDKSGYASLALAMEEGVDRLGAKVLTANPGVVTALAPSRLDREDLKNRGTAALQAVNLCRQLAALHRMQEAKRWLEAGLKLEPARPDLKALQVRVERDLADAEDDFKAANSMRKHVGGAVHALSALDHGLKKCADHPQLQALKKEMEAAFEERTSPQVTSAMVAASGGNSSKPLLEEGRKIYTTRCTECHDLELLDSRSMDGWSRAVSSMGRRAHLDEAQVGRILEYLTAAQRTLSN